MEARLLVHGFTGSLFFYVPVLFHHLTLQLGAAGYSRTQAAAMGVLALFSVGITLAEYPSGVFADWAGRARSMIVGSVLIAAGVGLFLMPASLLALAGSQVLLGFGGAFRSGANTALLYDHLRAEGRDGDYPRALARVRLANVAGLACGSLLGGLVYAWSPQLVFVLSILAALVSVVPLIGIDERHERPADCRYRDVFRRSWDEARTNRPALALLLLGGIGTTYFLFTYWGTQAYLVQSAAAPALMGVAVAGISLLAAAAMPLSAWLAHPQERNARSTGALLAALVGGLAGAALAHVLGFWAAGAVLLVAASACHFVYRNVINVQLQRWVPDDVRASMLSLESLVGSVSYVVLFPIGGWLLDTGGIGGGFSWLALLMVTSIVPLYLLAKRRGVWRT